MVTVHLLLQYTTELQSTILCNHYANVKALVKHEKPNMRVGNATHEQYLLKTVLNQLRMTTSRLSLSLHQANYRGTTELAFKAARYFFPSKLNELKPASDTYSELVSLPWCKSKSTDM